MEEPLIFQVVDWFSEDVIIEDEDEIDEFAEEENPYKSKYKPTEYQITIFGRDKNRKSVAVTVTGFKPSFYIGIPESWSFGHINNFIDGIKLKMGRISDTGFAAPPKFVRKKKFRGFHNNKEFSFILFQFNNRKTMNICKKQFEVYIQGETPTDWKVEPRPLSLPPMFSKPTIYSLYESNIDPILRCIHQQELFPSGWISISKYKTVRYDSELTCDIHVKTHYTHLKKYDTSEIGPIRICAFDIECNSSHCDFPLAIKTYQKFARDLHVALVKSEYDEYEDETKEEILEYVCAHVFDMNEVEIDKDFCKEIGLELDNIGKVYTKYQKKPSDKKVKKVIKELIKCIEIPSVSLGVRDKAELNNKVITKVTKICDRNFPKIEGDEVVQIASTIIDYGDEICCKKQLITLGKCSDIQCSDIEVIQCKTETEVLLTWRKLILEMDPDIITGYNTYGFDTPFLYDRSVELGIDSIFTKLGRYRERESKIKTKRLSSAALGDNIWRELQITGRIQIDIMRVVQRDYNLTSWSLDYVSSYFMNGKIKNLESVSGQSRQYRIETNNTKGIQENSYVNIMINNGITTDLYGEHTKFKVVDFTENSLLIEGDLEIDEIPFTVHSCTWCHAKDDIEYNDIFASWSKNLKVTEDVLQMRAKSGRYCVRDAILCLDLKNKLDILANNIGMSNVCSVPLSWIFARGQGVKTLSLVSKQCKKEGFVLPVLYRGNDPEYEGAIVLKPSPGIYTKEAIAVVDYASLYPSCIISENMSHDSIALDKQWLGEEGKKNLKDAGYGFVDIEWDVYKTVGNKKKKVKKETSRFVQFPDKKKAVIPRILDHLLTARRDTRRKIKFKTLLLEEGSEISGIVKEKDNSYHVCDEKKETHVVAKDKVQSMKVTYSPFQQGVMDGLQKAYKITANSIYGQMGAKTSPVKMIPIAACTTATGRNLLMTAKNYIRDHFQDTTIDVGDRSVYVKNSDTVYGDTDSVFLNFNVYDKKGGKKLTGKELLKATIDLGVVAGKRITQTLKAPHDLEYEKTFYPFILLSKKRYVGMKYEFDLNKCKQTSMGIVLKRRDNAKIVKYVYGGAIDIIMKEQNIMKALNFVKNSVYKLTNGKFGMDYLIITKSLRSYYKNPQQIAHKVLADRMGERDPGNKPKSNDRIPYVYIVKKCRKKEKILQGDRIENPTFIMENNLEIDYRHYITNQISKPVCQVFALELEQMPKYQLTPALIRRNREYQEAKEEQQKIKKYEFLRREREKQTHQLLFADAVSTITNSMNMQRDIRNFFTPVKIPR